MLGCYIITDTYRLYTVLYRNHTEIVMAAVSDDNFDLILSMLEEEEFMDGVFDQEIAESVEEVRILTNYDNLFTI